MADPVVRFATREDVSTILDIIKEGARAQKATPQEFQVTEESLLATLSFPDSKTATSPSFSPGFAKAVLLSIPGSGGAAEQIAGMALYYSNYSTWLAAPGIYLEDLCIRPEHRRKGFATVLLKWLAGETGRISGGKGRLDWACLKWNKNALDFYESIGGVQKDEWVGIRVEGDSLKKLAGES